MKKLLFISILILLGFSCKKERLKENKELLIGKWELVYTLSYYFDIKRRKYYFSDTLTPGINVKSRFITFKKSGKVISEFDGEESTHKMNFKTKYSDYASFDDEKSRVNLFTKDGEQYLGDFYKFKANFHNKGDDDDANVISGAVNDEFLKLRMGWELFTEVESGGSTYQRIFKRVE